MNMYLQSDKEISFVLQNQKDAYKKHWNIIELEVVHKLHHTDTYFEPLPLFHRLFSSIFAPPLTLEKWILI